MRDQFLEGERDRERKKKKKMNHLESKFPPLAIGIKTETLLAS
jgi:hypothetical protein